jgi:uncharacterized membrane protein YkvI
MFSFIRAILIPAAVFQSVIVGGAYGTGREVVEYISNFGPLGGLLAIAVIALSFGLILAVSFEFARIHATWDYRSYLRELLGSAWLAYEILFLALLILVLAITGAASGTTLHERFGLSETLGTALMFIFVVVLNYLGRDFVKRTLSIGAIIMMAVLAFYFVAVFRHAYPDIKQVLLTNEIKSGWLLSGITFAVYNSALVPAIIYCASGLTSRSQAFSAGILAGMLGAFPALVFHLSFLAGYPEILSQSLPTYWMIEQLGASVLLTLYVMVLFATIVQTGVGVLQGFNERLDGWRRETAGAAFSKTQHAFLAGGLLLLSLLLAKIGIIDLVAKGYTALACGFVIVFTIPTLTIGVKRILGNQGR